MAAKKQKAKAEQPAQPKAQKPKEEKPKEAAKRYWSKRFYIPGFGFVDVGEEASKESLAAWSKKTKLDVNNYLNKE